MTDGQILFEVLNPSRDWSSMAAWHKEWEEAATTSASPAVRALIREVRRLIEEPATAGWQPIETAPKAKDDRNGDQSIASVCSPHFDAWLTVPASPRSMGISDAWRVTDVWQTSKGAFWHLDQNGRPAELYRDYVTHWMPLPSPPCEEAATVERKVGD